GLGDAVASIISEQTDQDVDTINLKPNENILGNAVDHEPIEVGRITKAEFRRLLVAFDLLDIPGIMSGKDLGIELLTDLIDPNNPNDDFATLMESDYIYTLIAQLFENTSADDQIANALETFVGKPVGTISIASPTDAKGTIGVEDGLITRAELRQMMVSVKLLGLTGIPDESSVTFASILDLIGANEVLGVDDFHRFLASKYIASKISTVLTLDAIIELIANEMFDHTQFALPASATETIGSEERMTVAELHALFSGLKLLGLDDFENVEFEIDTITDLSEAEINTLLDSSYLYVVIDLIIKAQDDLDLPADAYVTAGEFAGRIKKTEIVNVFKAFDILGTSDPSLIDVETIMIKDIQDLFDLNSPIIDQIISDAIVDTLDSIPLTAYNVEETRLTRVEMQKLIDALMVLSGNDDEETLANMMPIDENTISTTVLRDLYDLDSRLIDRVLSSAIIDSGLDIPTGSYDPLSEEDEFFNKLDLDRSELDALIAALEELTIDIADADTIPLSSLTPIKVDALIALDSLIIYRLIAENIIAQNLDTPDSHAIFGDDNYDANNVGKDIKISEMNALVDAMDILGITDLSVAIEVDDTTVDDIVALEALNSSIVDRLLSTGMIAVLDIPSGALLTAEDLVDDEIAAVVDALAILAGANSATMTLNDFGIINNNTLTPAVLDDLLDLDSLIIYRLIAQGIIDANLDTPESLAEFGDDNHDALAIGADIKISEMYALVDAMDIMSITDLSVSMDAATITAGQLDDLSSLNSLIVDRIISTAIIDSGLDIPSGAYVIGSTEDITKTEIDALIASMIAITGDDTGTIASILPVDDADFTPTLLTALLDEESLIIYRMIATAIITEGIDTPESIAEDGDFNYDALDIGADIKQDEMYGLANAMLLLGVANVTEVMDLDLATVLTLTDGEIDDLLDNTNTILYYLVSDLAKADPGIVAALNNDDYVDDNPANNILRSVLITVLKGLN
ncbi:MAG: hypothetical protein IH571_07455, partial [Acholeplasmataceae bacterium]|nr:hypothetical protein [Acholeplasmataceae bacterium]